MDVTDILNIISGDEKNLGTAFESFLIKNNQTLSFSELGLELRKDIWSAVFRHLENEKYCMQCLSAVRILSRDKEQLDEIISEKWIDTLLIRSDLKPFTPDNVAADNKIVLEALKCLCNLVYNSKTIQNICAQNDAAENIFKRLISYRNLDILDEIKYFDMKLLFLITAFCVDIRLKIKEKFHGVTYLAEYLAYMLKSTDETKEMSKECVLSDDKVNLVCEILKVLFNLTINIESYMDTDEDDSYLRLTAVIHDYIFASTTSPAKQIELQTHIINLLTTLPNCCLKKLVTVIPKGEKINRDLQYEGYNMEVVHVLLAFLKKKFSNDTTGIRQQESLLPILTVLVKLSKSSRVSRKYLRKNILPPLRDVHNRPEQGNTLRNNLCRLLTTPVTQLRDLSADLLFILCKENVARMIKYTGYGNAAGLFASRGLLGKASDKSNADNGEQYSSDSEDSDTEEYKEYKHGINPVVGCYEPPHPDPTEGMTEEQKEYEAMKLVQLMDSLQRQGIVQPCRVGEDGKPEPITHVLQLQEEFNGNKNS